MSLAFRHGSSFLLDLIWTYSSRLNSTGPHTVEFADEGQTTVELPSSRWRSRVDDAKLRLAAPHAEDNFLTSRPRQTITKPHARHARHPLRKLQDQGQARSASRGQGADAAPLVSNVFHQKQSLRPIRSRTAVSSVRRCPQERHGTGRPASRPGSPQGWRRGRGH